jgi:hypothetical protein
VNAITKTNMVVEIGTTRDTFDMNSKAVYLPCLSRHLPTREIWLFSLQVYHTLYGGHSIIFGNKTAKLIDTLSITISITANADKIPMVPNPVCNAKK